MPTITHINATGPSAATTQCFGTLQSSYPQSEADSAKNGKITEGSCIRPGSLNLRLSRAISRRCRLLPEKWLFWLNC